MHWAVGLQEVEMYLVDVIGYLMSFPDEVHGR